MTYKIIVKPFAISVLLAGAVFASAADAPVTRAEVAKVMYKVETVMRRGLEIPGEVRMVKPAPGVATRQEIVGEFHRLYVMSMPKFRLTAAPVPVPAQKYTLGKGPAMAQAFKLASAGAVSVIGPLVTGKSPGLTPKQFGDAIGYLMARVAELSHMPSTKFTPALQRG